MDRQGLAAVFVEAGRPLELRTMTVLDPVGAEILVKVTACTLCGSDLHTFEGRRLAPSPSILGHEILGLIEAFGPEARRSDLAGLPLVEGDRVTWSVVASCGACFYCERGLSQKCEHMVKYGHEPLSDRPTGGLAEYCLLAPGSAIVRIPDALSDRVACPSSCATATASAAIRAAGSIEGRVILIQGAGMLGLTASAMAKQAGASEVICVDPIPERLALARRFGATRAVAPEALAGLVAGLNGGRGVDAAIEMTGSPEAFEAALPLLRIGATYVLIGAVYPGRPVEIAMETIVRRTLTLRGLHNYAPEDLLTAVRFLAGAEAYPFEELVEGWFPLSEANAAFGRSKDPGVLRVGVRC
jgi:putative phosphonate catabolism associated alcohol dehydrogenase